MKTFKPLPISNCNYHLPILCLFQIVLTAALLLACSEAKAVIVQVTITPVKMNGFSEFKCESDQKGEQATGHITAFGAKTYEWDMGNQKQNIWFWWDALQGAADITINIYQDGSRDGNGRLTGHAEMILSGRCSHSGTGEQLVLNTMKEWLRKNLDPSGSAVIEKTQQNTVSGQAYCKENGSGAITHIYFKK
jgi:hypothetical protein